MNMTSEFSVKNISLAEDALHSTEKVLFKNTTSEVETAIQYISWTVLQTMTEIPPSQKSSAWD